MKIQARIQGFKRGELRRQLQLWKPLEDYITLLFVLVRNIVGAENAEVAHSLVGYADEVKNENTKEKMYILSLHKIHAELFPEADLEEKMNHWVRKEFKNFNEDARLSIQHWKDSWHKRVYKQNQRKVRDNT
ncbi:hypothetical protein Tco_0550770 [Tanacetum coccineum]